jgi:DNA repair exonuclease SbcCD ATPase subunit
MRSHILGGFLVISCLCLSGCGNAVKQHEEVLNEVVQLMTEFAVAIEGINDPESAKAAAKKIDEITAKLEALDKKAKALPRISAEENTRLETKMKQEIETIKNRVQKGMSPERMAKAGPSMLLVAEAAQRMVQKAEKLKTTQ